MPVTHVERPGNIVVRVEVNYGLLDSCDMREAPHVIEHLVLSETKFGRTPADLIATLARKGVRATAVTRQDFTEYVFEGAPGTGSLISQAVLETVGRSTLPISSAVREVEAIRLELGKGKGFVSESHAFEQWAYEHILGTPKPCMDSSVPVDEFSHAKFSDLFQNHYGVNTYSLTVAGPGAEIDAAALADGLRKRRPGGVALPRITSTQISPMDEYIPVAGGGSNVGLIEVLVGIDGRKTFPPSAAKLVAEALRVEIQTQLRHQPIGYTAKTVVHQSNTAGWISIYASIDADDHAEIAEQLRNIAIDVLADPERISVQKDFLTNRDVAEDSAWPLGNEQFQGLKPKVYGVTVQYMAKNGSSNWSQVVTVLIGGIIIWGVLMCIWRKLRRKRINELLG
jgi:hypothetical protein